MCCFGAQHFDKAAGGGWAKLNTGCGEQDIASAAAGLVKKAVLE